MKNQSSEVIVISHVHSGIYSGHDGEPKHYFESIASETQMLNVDILDIWQFSKNNWPNSHLKVIRQILQISENETKINLETNRCINEK